MHRDFLDFIEECRNYRVRFVIIGGLALAFYGHPRYTGDLDIWIEPSLENVRNIFQAIESFFSTSLEITPEDFLKGHKMITLGEEPIQIQIHLSLDGVTADEIWESKTKGKFGSSDVFFIGKETFIKNKHSVGRAQDLADIQKIQDSGHGGSGS